MTIHSGCQLPLNIVRHEGKPPTPLSLKLPRRSQALRHVSFGRFQASCRIYFGLSGCFS